jgi:hypothetical protein
MEQGGPEAGLCGFLAVMGAELEGKVVQCAGVTRRRRTVLRHRMGQLFLPHPGMPGKAAGSQDNSARHGDVARLPILAEGQSGDGPILRAQRNGFRLRQDMHAQAQRRREHAADQGIAHDKTRIAPVAQAGDIVLADELRGVNGRLKRLAYLEKMGNVVTVDHHAAKDGEFRNGRADQLECISQGARIERLRLQRTTASGRPFQFGEIIRMQRSRAELHLGPSLEFSDHAGPSLEESFPHRAWRSVADSIVEVSQNLVVAVLRADRPGVMRQRYPRRGSGKGGRTSQIFSALDKQHPGAFQRREHRGRHAARAGSQHNNIIAVRGMTQSAIHELLLSRPLLRTGEP